MAFFTSNAERGPEEHHGRPQLIGRHTLEDLDILKHVFRFQVRPGLPVFVPLGRWVSTVISIANAITDAKLSILRMHISFLSWTERIKLA